MNQLNIIEPLSKAEKEGIFPKGDKKTVLIELSKEGIVLSIGEGNARRWYFYRKKLVEYNQREKR